MVIIALALLLHSPLLDVNRLSVKNQVERLLSGQVSVKDFDYGALRFKLGRLGREAIDDLLLQTSHPEYETISAQVARVKTADNYWSLKNQTYLIDADAFERVFTIWPRDQVIRRAERNLILRNLHWRDREVCQNEADCILLAVNLDGDDDREYLLLSARNSIKQLHIYDIQGTQCDVRVMYLSHDMWLSPEELAQALETGQIATRPSMLRDIQIGERRFSFSP